MHKFRITVVAAIVAVGVMATAAIAATSKPTVAVHKTAVGKVLVGANGRTVYLFTADKGKKSACYGQCAAVWPPLIGAKPPLAPA
jgi:predicted lipoprotein with Yx(FWY)xxD motif